MLLKAEREFLRRQVTECYSITLYCMATKIKNKAEKSKKKVQKKASFCQPQQNDAFFVYGILYPVGKVGGNLASEFGRGFHLAMLADDVHDVPYLMR